MGHELLEEFWIGEGYEKPGETLMPKNEVSISKNSLKVERRLTF